MAKLSVDPTLEALITTITSLELQLAELKKIANALALERAVRPPFLEARSVASATASAIDGNGGPVADAQD